MNTKRERVSIVHAMKLALAFVSALALVAPTAALADKPAEKPAESKDVPAAYAAKYLAFFDKVVDTTVADKDDCDKMGGDLTAMFAANADLLDEANQLKKAGKKFDKAAQDHMLEGIKKMAPAINKCMVNEKVKAAFKTFSGKDDKKK